MTLTFPKEGDIVSVRVSHAREGLDVDELMEACVIRRTIPMTMLEKFARDDLRADRYLRHVNPRGWAVFEIAGGP